MAADFDERALSETARTLARQLDSADLTRTLESMTRGAVVAVPQVSAASITFTRADGSLETVAQTDDMLLELDVLQYRLQEGPCYQAAVEDRYVVAADLLGDERFPRYGPAAVERGIRAQAGLALFHRSRSRGALNLYGARSGALDDLVSLGPLLAHQATMTLSYAVEATTLRQAMETRAMIGRAVGIVMERYQLSEDRAFAFLARLSQHHNVKLRDVARTVVGSVPGAEEGSPGLS